jgi:hypothetical protein
LATVKRRYYESQLFGLYDHGTTSDSIDSAICKEAYGMYHEFKDQIINHEKQFSVKILEANAQYGLSGDNAIQTLEQSFQLAYNHIRNSKTVARFATNNASRRNNNPPPLLTPWQPAQALGYLGKNSTSENNTSGNQLEKTCIPQRQNVLAG